MIGCAHRFNVVIPQRGQPYLYSDATHSMENWKSKTKPDFQCQFVRMDGTHWYWDGDCNRQPLREIVVHHTFSTAPPTTKEDIADFEAWLSETEAERLYLPEFKDPKADTPHLFELPFHSPHIIEGKGETFTAYHHVIFPDGKLVTALVPYRKIGNTYYVDMVAWHAGKWAINVESVAVVLVGHFVNGRNPTAKAIRTLNNLVDYYRNLVPDIKVMSHHQVTGRTECPGAWFEEWIKTVPTTNMWHP